MFFAKCHNEPTVVWSNAFRVDYIGSIIWQSHLSHWIQSFYFRRLNFNDLGTKCQLVKCPWKQIYLDQTHMPTYISIIQHILYIS